MKGFGSRASIIAFQNQQKDKSEQFDKSEKFILKLCIGGVICFKFDYYDI
jgi:hypothetical protein